MAIRNDEGGADSEDDDDIVIGVGENFRKHIDALKRACVLEVGNGGYISTPASILSGNTPPAFEENDDDDDDEDEDDDELFLSIKSKHGSFGFADSSPWLATRAGGADKKSEDGLRAAAEGEEENADDEEDEDDEEILRSVEKLYKTGVGGSGGGGGQVPSFPASVPEVVSPQLKESSRDTNDILRVEKTSHPSPSPHASPGCEPGGNVGGEDGGFSPPQTRFETGLEQVAEGGRPIGFSPQTRSETRIEQGEEVGRSIASFLPGNWIDTDGDVQYADATPPGPLESVSTEHGGNNLSATPEEAIIYSHPENAHAHALTDALKKNREYQRTLRNVLSQIEAKQKENTELQKRVRSLVDFEKYCNRRFAGFFTDQANPSIKLIAAKAHASQNKSSDSSIKTVGDLQACGPPENPDVEIYKKLQKKVSFTFPCRRWSNDERMELTKGVKQQVFEVLVRQAMDTLSNAEALDEEFNSLDDYVSKIGRQEFSPQQIRDAVSGIDWAEVSRVYVVGRTPEECRTRWINHEDSLINKGPWKKMEDKKLLSIAQQHNFSTWEKIAEQLGTNRTPAECLTRYQRSLNASIMRSNWTPEEDNRLRAAVEEWGENDWSAVAACLEGRNNSQCLMRWYKVLHPTKKKRGRWSVEEDKRLKWAVSVYGPKKWKQIAEHVPGRTDLQCRERWCNVLDPSIKLGEWTEDEDRILEESVARHGPHRWAAVANDLKIRTDNQCCRRWKFLHPEDQPEFLRAVHIRRTALVGNFQGRKKERPRLGPQDFISKGMDFEALAKKSAGKRHVKDKQVGEPIGNGDAARERRAARILKRKFSRARKASNDGGQKIASARDVQTDNEFMDVIDPNNTISELQPGSLNTELGNLDGSSKRTKRKRLPFSDPLDNGSRPRKRKQTMPLRVADALDPSEKSDKRRKRKAVHIADPIDPSRRSKLKVSRSNQGPRVSPTQDTSRDMQSVGPEIVSFLDLVQSLEGYCSALVGEENRVARFSDATETQEPAEIITDVVDKSFRVRSSETNESLAEKTMSRNFSNEESNMGPRSMDVSDGDSRHRGAKMSDQGNGHFSREDEEVASATRAVLSWPFLRGVQELLSQGTTRRTDLVCEGRTDHGSQGMKDLGSQLTADLGPQGFGSHGSSHDADQVGPNNADRGTISSTPVRKSKRISLRSQGRTALRSQAMTEILSQGGTCLGAEEGTNKGDIGSVPSVAVRKPRSTRPVRMRGALTWKNPEEVSMVSRTTKPWFSAYQSVQDDNS